MSVFDAYIRHNGSAWQQYVTKLRIAYALKLYIKLKYVRVTKKYRIIFAEKGLRSITSLQYSKMDLYTA